MKVPLHSKQSSNEKLPKFPYATMSSAIPSSSISKCQLSSSQTGSDSSLALYNVSSLQSNYEFHLNNALTERVCLNRPRMTQKGGEMLVTLFQFSVTTHKSGLFFLPITSFSNTKYRWWSSIHVQLRYLSTSQLFTILLICWVFCIFRLLLLCIAYTIIYKKKLQTSYL